MNLDVLKHLVKNDPETITRGVQKKHDPKAALGVANFLIGNNGDVEKLSPKQRYYWTRYIRPLIEDVPCEGVFGDGEVCTGNGFVDDESLLLGYQDDSLLCQVCRYDRDKMRSPN